MTEYIQILLLTVILLVLLDEYSTKKFKKQKNTIVLDSSALIDGRILEVAKSGFIPGKLVIPQFVIEELQLLADGGDSHKRERARFGLDIINELKNELGSKVKISNTDFSNISKTDDKLLKLSKKNFGILMHIRL